MKTEVYVDPAGAFIEHKDKKYYPDGILYGYILAEWEKPAEQELSMPTLWSSVVIKYRKKPAEVYAIQLGPENAEEVARWCGGLLTHEIDPHDEEKRYVAINVPTLEGVMRASEGDYIIKGVKGEFYPCKPDIFSATYEVV